jgi:hypothetical protein
MSRKPIRHGLPPLAESLPSAALPPGENRAAQLRAALRTLAGRFRQSRPRPFYTMREVAAHLALPLQTVARAYAALEHDGLLTRFRGARTVLRGTRQRPRRSLRGVVGMPIWLPGFVVSRDWRVFFIRLEEELRRHNFIADFVFFHHDEDLQPEFCTRLRQHHLDTVLWFVPPPGAQATIASLRDDGLRVIIVGQAGERLPGSQYEIDRRPALARALDAWLAAGVRRALLCFSIKGASRFERQQHVREREMVRLELARRGVDTAPADFADPDAVARLRRGADPGAALVFLRPTWYHGLWRRQPALMVELLRTRRVLFTVDVGDVGDFPCDGLCADVIALDYPALAARLAGDLHEERLPDPRRPAAIMARWLPGVPLTVFNESGP